MLHLRVITPKKVVLDEEVASVTAPGAEGEMTILPRHSHLFSQLKEGIVTIRRKNGE
ncbi:F0F1 ATP synthase subunit epsilon, partial [Candidatus Microgenomates bacterium]|nr:F0F1 ATP synthase subunit epsilon [Candidatus Microgenomates bacterium]